VQSHLLDLLSPAFNKMENISKIISFPFCHLAAQIIAAKAKKLRDILKLEADATRIRMYPVHA